MKRALGAWAPALVYMAGIFIASAQRTVPSPGFNQSDKVLHFAAYAGLGAALAFAGARTGWGVLPLVVLGSLYGVSDEIHQGFVPGRSPDVLDWAADTAGVLAGVLAFSRFFSRRRARGERGGTPAAPPGADPLRR